MTSLHVTRRTCIPVLTLLVSLGGGGGGAVGKVGRHFLMKIIFVPLIDDKF